MNRFAAALRSATAWTVLLVIQAVTERSAVADLSPKVEHARTGMVWRHVVISTMRSWLHGDGRGFRSRNHRIHSSGDYQRRPPEGEHSGLYSYHKSRAQNEIHFDPVHRPIIGRAMIDALYDGNFRVRSIAITKVHAHVLIELPESYPETKRIVGDAKRKSSRAVKASLPGAVWSTGGSYKRVEDSRHFESAHKYILFDQGPGAWTWSVKDKSMEGQFRRKRPT